MTAMLSTAAAAEKVQLYAQVVLACVWVWMCTVCMDVHTTGVCGSKKRIDVYTN